MDQLTTKLPKQLFFIRHAHQDWHREYKWQPERDTLLSITGHHQANQCATELKQLLKDKPHVTILSSDQLRARQTAQRLQHAIGARAKLVVIPTQQTRRFDDKGFLDLTVHHGLRERYYGNYYRLIMCHSRAIDTIPEPGMLADAESWPALKQRMLTTLAQACHDHTRVTEQAWVVVGHKAAFSALFSCLNPSVDWDPEQFVHASITEACRVPEAPGYQFKVLYRPPAPQAQAESKTGVRPKRPQP